MIALVWAQVHCLGGSAEGPGYQRAGKARRRHSTLKSKELLASVGKGAKLSLAGLLMMGAMTIAIPDLAEATPVYDVCYPGNEVGAYNWAYDEYGNFSNYIEINSCALDRMGAGPQDYQNVLDHELGHAAGYGHSDDSSNLMFPQMLITGY